MGYTSPVLAGGGGEIPQSCSGQGVPLSWPRGYPSHVLAGCTPVLVPSDQDWDTPWPGLRYLPTRTGVPPPGHNWDTSPPGLGYPSWPQKGPGTRGQGKNLGLGCTPCGRTDTYEKIIFPIFRMRVAQNKTVVCAIAKSVLFKLHSDGIKSRSMSLSLLKHDRQPF